MNRKNILWMIIGMTVVLMFTATVNVDTEGLKSFATVQKAQFAAIDPPPELPVVEGGVTDGKDYNTLELVTVFFTESYTEPLRVRVSPDDPGIKFSVTWTTNAMESTGWWDGETLIKVYSQPQSFAKNKKEMFSGVISYSDHTEIFVPRDVSKAVQKKFFLCAVDFVNEGNCGWDEAKNY